MVFAANAAEGSSKSFEAFVALAMQLNGTSSGNVTGSGNGKSSGNGASHAASTHAGQSAAALVALALGVVIVL